MPYHFFLKANPLEERKGDDKKKISYLVIANLQPELSKYEVSLELVTCEDVLATCMISMTIASLILNETKLQEVLILLKGFHLPKKKLFKLSLTL